jgi:hypothetical protein
MVWARGDAARGGCDASDAGQLRLARAQGARRTLGVIDPGLLYSDDLAAFDLSLSRSYNDCWI